MKRSLIPLIGLALALAALVTPAGAGDVGSYTVEMDGANEVPGPGDPDGSGSATIVLGTVTNQVCVDELTLSNIDDPIAMHIHAGAAGVAGGIVVNLTDALDSLPFCTDVTEDVMRELITRPECYYLNVHTEEYPDGAIRGQLVDGECVEVPTTLEPTTTSSTTTAPAADTISRPRFTG